MVTSVYLIRHCEAVGNVTGIFQGHMDGDITEKGALQLEQLKEYCKKIPFDAVYSSPLLRAKKTAEAVCFYHDMSFVTENDLIEINGGDMEGRKWSELPELFPEHFPLWKTDFALFTAPNGESVSEVYCRIKNCILNIIEKNKGKNIGVVAHGGVFYTFLAYINGYKPEEISNRELWVDNTSITRVDFDGNNYKLIFFNDCSHINNSPETSARMRFW